MMGNGGNIIGDIKPKNVVTSVEEELPPWKIQSRSAKTGWQS